LQASNVDDHHVAHQLPVDQHNQAHIAKLPVRDDGCAVLCQHGINHRLPGVAQHNATEEQYAMRLKGQLTYQIIATAQQ